MDFNEKKLYHQIHPVKLFTDWITGLIALLLLWFHYLGMALIVMFLPSITVTVVLIKYANLEKFKNSPFGNYIHASMTRNMEIVRFMGFGVAILGAWYHFIWLIFCGIIIILFGWVRGIVVST